MGKKFTNPDKWLKWWASRNPFTIAYTQEEIAFYGVSEYDKDGVVITSSQMVGAVDDYFNKAFHVGDIRVPMLSIDKRLWMSITCMETQSQHIPIQLAAGNVGTAGLGMGHFTLRCMENPGVDTITVFEDDERIVSFFKSCFSKRPGYDKVSFVLGDARETILNYHFDFLYVDIYSACLPDEVISDAKLFLGNNDIEPENYHFWGQERVILDAINLGVIEMADVPLHIQSFLLRWFNQPVEGCDFERMGQEVKLSDMYEIKIDETFAEQSLEAIDFHDRFF